MNEQNQAQEPMEVNAVTVQPQRQVQQMQEINSVAALEQAMKVAEKYQEVQVRLRRLALRSTNINDWLDQGGKPYLQWSGFAQIAAAFGVQYNEPKIETFYVDDDAGRYFQCDVSGMIFWQGHAIPETGSANSRDELYGVRTVKGEDGKAVYENGKKKTYFLPLSEINLGDIRKKALTNFLNRGLKSTLGLSFTWEEIAETTQRKITKDLVAAIDYKKDGKGGGFKAAQTSGVPRPGTLAPQPSAQPSPAPQHPPVGNEPPPNDNPPPEKKDEFGWPADLKPGSDPSLNQAAQNQPSAQMNPKDLPDKKAQLWLMILQIFDGNEIAAQKYLEQCTTFEGRDK